MADVIDLDARRPHYAGPCSCLSCTHEWVGVVPVGAKHLECSVCGKDAGVMFSAREVRFIRALEEIATGDSGNEVANAAIMRGVAVDRLSAEGWGDF